MNNNKKQPLPDTKLGFPLKRQNAILEYDRNNNTIYIFIPPYSHKNFPKVAKTEEIMKKGPYGLLLFDYDENEKLVGIEVHCADELINLNKIFEKG